MEINKWTDIFGGQTLEAMAEGRMVVLTASTEVGLYGVKLPASSAEALKAKYVVTWPPTNLPAPYYTPMPSMAFALRGGFDQPANSPFTAEVSQIYAGDRLDSTVPSGTIVRVYDRGVFTVTSGNFIYSADIAVKGNALSVAYADPDKGKLQYASDGTIGIVEDFDATNFTLTFRTL